MVNKELKKDNMAYEGEGIFMDISAENEKCMQNLLCNIMRRRLEAGLSVKEMANVVGMEESLLLRLEAGEQAEDVYKRQTQNRYGIACRGGGNGFMRFYEYLASELETPAIFPGDNDTTILEDPRAQELFEKFYGLYKNGQAPKDSVNWAFKEMVEGFINGQCGTLNQTPEVTITCEQSMEDGTWTVLPFPSKEGAQKKVLLWGQTAGYMVSANCKDKEAGFDFIRYISSCLLYTSR